MKQTEWIAIRYGWNGMNCYKVWMEWDGGKVYNGMIQSILAYDPESPTKCSQKKSTSDLTFSNWKFTL